jgi:hypothetical protein
MAVQRAEKNSSRSHDYPVILAFIVMCAVIAFAGGLCLTLIFPSYVSANVVSFLLTGAAAFVIMHFIFTEEMSQFDSRVLHELAKRKLVEVAVTEDELAR